MQFTSLPSRVVQVTWGALRLFTRAQGLSWGGAVGLYLFLSVPPLMVASSLLLQPFMSKYAAEDFVLDQAVKFVPARIDLLTGVFGGNTGSSIAIALVSLGFLLFSGSRAFAALSSGVNVMWHQSDEVTFWGRQLMRLWMLGASLALLLLGGLIELTIGAMLSDSTDSGEIWLLEWQLIPTILLGLFVFAAYKTLPKDDVPWQHAAIGAAIATVGVRISQAVMGVMSEAGSFETPYGALAGVALMATWALVIGVMVLFGATIVAVLGGRLEELEREGSDPLEG
jgi:membrane protein